MAARTIQTPAALRRDTRFQACSPGAKWVFGHLCDRREVVAEPGLDVLGTVALIVEGLGDTPRDVLAPLLMELERDRGLVTMEADRLVVHTLETAADKRGPRGGKVGAQRTAEYRARLAAKAAAASVTGVTSHVTVTVTDSVTSHDPSQSANGDGCDGSIRHVTGSVTDSPSQNPSRDGQCDGLGLEAADIPPPPAPPSRLSPHTPLSYSPSAPTPTNPQRAGEGLDLEAVKRLAALEALEAARVAKEAKRAALAAKRAARKESATPADTIPLAGTAAHVVYLAIVGDPALQPITGNPGDFAVRVTAEGAYPGVDVLATILDGAEYVARNPGVYSDGRAFLRNALQRAKRRAEAQPKPGNPLASGVFELPRASASNERAELEAQIARDKAAYYQIPIEAGVGR